MKIGIFLAYGPRIRFTSEGLGRYLGNLIKGFLGAGHEVTIACPEWSVQEVCALCDDYRIELSSIKFLVSYERPVLWDIYQKLSKKRTAKRYRVKLIHTVTDLLQKLLAFLVSITSGIAFAGLSILFAALGVLGLPLLLVGVLFYGIFLLSTSIGSKGKCVLRLIFKKVNNLFIVFTEKGLSIYDTLIELLTQNVEEALVRKINKYAKPVDVWYSPAAFWPSFCNIKGVRVVNIPDLVSKDFALLFSASNYAPKVIQKIVHILNSGGYYITYCTYFKNQLLQEYSSLEPANICAIPHSINTLHQYITVDSTLEQNLNSSISFTTVFARQCLQTLCNHAEHDLQSYLAQFNFENVRYIFYASQIRSHKNVLNLVKAYRYVLRERYCNVKLILTGNLRINSQLYDYIHDQRLQFDVLSFSNVSSQQLAALYHCAELVVNPTLYEGGFPFTFAEGMSVGTPSVMSRIPQVTEEIQKYQLDEMLFDPYDWKSIADRIEYGLHNRQALYQREFAMYKDMEKRTQVTVAAEYIETFARFIELDKQKRKTAYE